MPGTVLNTLCKFANLHQLFICIIFFIQVSDILKANPEISNGVQVVYLGGDSGKYDVPNIFMKGQG